MKTLNLSTLSLLILGIMMASCCPNKVTDSGKLLINSYADLVTNQRTNSCTNIPVMHCNKYYIPKGDLVDIDSLPKTSFTSYFRTDTAHFAYKAFGTPICTDSLVDTNGNKQFMEMWRSVYSDNCPECFPDRTMLPKKKYANWEWQRVIFVPVSTYKELPNKQFNYSDFERLQKLAINPQQMKAIKEPYLESCNGYLATLNPLLKAKREDEKSITGIMCNVELITGGKDVPCYVFNKESFGASNPYLNWKK